MTEKTGKKAKTGISGMIREGLGGSLEPDGALPSASTDG